jgi:hypothetical protein
VTVVTVGPSVVMTVGMGAVVSVRHTRAMVVVVVDLQEGVEVEDVDVDVAASVQLHGPMSP